MASRLSQTKCKMPPKPIGVRSEYNPFAHLLSFNAERMHTTLMTPPPATLPADTPQTIAEFYACWASLPRQHLVPRLCDYLDHAPFALQPFVSIVDILSADESRVRLVGTGIADLLGRDETGKPIPSIYPEATRALVRNVAWRAVGHRAGYLSTRIVRTKIGRALEAPSISLPLINRPGAAPLIMTYAAFPADALSIHADDQLHNTLDFKLMQWIDIGAGVPR